MFLDKPLPPNIRVVAVCEQCNRGASYDEEYFACAIDVALCGSVVDTALLRPKVAATLTHSAALRRRLESAERSEDDRGIGFECETARVERVLEKIARGLMAHDDADPQIGRGVTVRWSTLGELESETKADFMAVPSSQLFPEVGSRAFVRVIESGPGAEGCIARPSWTTVQYGRFSYLVDRRPEGPRVRMLFSDYVAAQCVFLA